MTARTGAARPPCGSSAERRRTTLALELRGWVLRKDDDLATVAQVLIERANAVDQSLTPHLDLVEWLYRQTGEILVQRGGWRRAGPVTREFITWYARRHLAWPAIADYWRKHPYRGSWYYPPIVTDAMPWEPLPPNAVHILDLGVDDLRRGLADLLGFLKRLRRERRHKPLTLPPSGALLTEPFLTMIVEGTIARVRLLGPRAWREPEILAACWALSGAAHYATRRVDQLKAARALRRVLEALRADTRRNVAATAPSRWDETAQVYDRTYISIEPFYRRLRDRGELTPELLREVRAAINPTLTAREVRGWLHLQLATVARSETRRLLRVPPDAVPRALANKSRAEDIHDIWTRFGKEWLTTRTKDDPLRLLLAPYPPPGRRPCCGWCLHAAPNAPLPSKGSGQNDLAEPPTGTSS